MGGWMDGGRAAGGHVRLRMHFCVGRGRLSCQVACGEPGAYGVVGYGVGVGVGCEGRSGCIWCRASAL
eukprot:98608-Chlamydomonas_euryale.AAC.1